MERLTEWKSRAAKIKLLYIPHHILIKFLFQLARKMYVTDEIGSDPMQEKITGLNIFC